MIQYDKEYNYTHQSNMYMKMLFIYLQAQFKMQLFSDMRNENKKQRHKQKK